jgi:hypothetical protein
VGADEFPDALGLGVAAVLLRGAALRRSGLPLDVALLDEPRLTGGARGERDLPVRRHRRDPTPKEALNRATATSFPPCLDQSPPDLELRLSGAHEGRSAARIVSVSHEIASLDEKLRRVWGE